MKLKMNFTCIKCQYSSKTFLMEHLRYPTPKSKVQAPGCQVLIGVTAFPFQNVSNCVEHADEVAQKSVEIRDTHSFYNMRFMLLFFIFHFYFVSATDGFRFFSFIICVTQYPCRCILLERSKC